MSSFWETVDALASTNEANVEAWLVQPLLEALGHERTCIDAKPSVRFQEGTRVNPGRKPEADFVVYAERPFSRANSLIVVEAKRPDEALDDGRAQGESYAQNLRAPILLLTNGRRLEVWQTHITTESRCILDCDVADLGARRGDLESLLSRESLKAHCASIEYKHFDLLARDLGSYERAEHDRLATLAGAAMPRTLLDADTKQHVGLDEILATPRALIVGASGYGKTTFAASLIWEGIERRWEGKATELPIDVFLPDLTPSRSFEENLSDRISAHRPGFSSTMLRTVAREQGLLIVADGFERVTLQRRDEIKSMLRNAMRDYPKTRLILLSRGNVAPTDVGLQRFELEGFSPEDLRELADRRSETHPHAAHAFINAPEHVYRVGKVPLLAGLLIDRYEVERRHSPRLAPLYEKWLNTVLASAGSVDRALDRALLEELARETTAGPISIGQAMGLAAARPNAERLHRLADADAISIRGTTVELQHEALADYLRALSFWAAPTEHRAAELPALAFDPGSQFAILLVETAPSAEWRGKAWQAVARANFRLAIQSLRFAAGDETFGSDTAEAEARRFLKDTLETIETLAGVHFGPVSGRLREELVGMPVERMGICGAVTADRVNFSFFDALDGMELIEIGRRDRDDRPFRAYGYSLKHYGYGPEAGRILGVDRLKGALHKLIKSRELQGGMVWIEERVFGRLRHLVEEHQFPVQDYTLQAAHDALMPHQDEWLAAGGFNHGQEFLIKDLLEDIAWLIERGKSRIDQWWDDPRSLDLHSEDGQRRFAENIHQYHLRRQLAYAEVVEHSFPALQPYLRTLRMMPLRMEIETTFYTRDGHEHVTLHHRRWPVRTYEEAGADVTFPAARSDRDIREAGQEYVLRTDELLARFGRSFPDRLITSGGTRMPDLHGVDTSFDGLPDESAVVRGAMALLKKDLDHLFAELPK